MAKWKKSMSGLQAAGRLELLGRGVIGGQPYVRLENAERLIAGQQAVIREKDRQITNLTNRFEQAITFIERQTTTQQTIQTTVRARVL